MTWLADTLDDLANQILKKKRRLRADLKLSKVLDSDLGLQNVTALRELSHLLEHRITNNHKLLLLLAYDGRVSNKRFRIPRKTDADVHAKTRAPIQADLACAA